jgi:multimeric flavodoxin WrbA
MNKLLGIVGSPRRQGNTDIMVRRILEGAAAAGAGTEAIQLADIQIHECNGCHACWKTGKCVQKDGMNELYPKIVESEVIIFGTPVYWYGPTALMKGFIDRFVYFNCAQNRPQIKGKSAVLVIPYEEMDPETAAPVVTFFEKSLRYLEVKIIEKFIIPGVTTKGEVVNQKDLMERAFRFGQSLGARFNAF